MSQRDSNLLWLKDMVAHLASCQKQLQWAQDSETVLLLTEAMLRDLEGCRRLCEKLQKQTCLLSAV